MNNKEYRNYLNILLCFFSIIFFSFQSYENELAICTIFRDDAKYLPEWIDFHKKQGVEKFYLYNNLSADNYQEILKPYIKSGLVVLVEWQIEQHSLNEWGSIQCEAYKNCINLIKNKVKWCAFIDTDEFIFCPNKLKLNEFLKDFEEFQGVGANWVIYGTSNVKKISKKEKLLNRLVFRAQDDFGPHIHIKSIVKVNEVESCTNPHFFIYKNGGHAVSENKERIDGPFSPYISFNKIRINHYWSRDLDFFYNIKLPRREKWGADSQSEISNEKIYMNDIYDPILSNTRR